MDKFRRFGLTNPLAEFSAVPAWNPWLVPEALTRRADFALALARQTPEIGFLSPFLSDASRNTLAQEKPALRAGLMLASPDFMSK